MSEMATGATGRARSERPAAESCLRRGVPRDPLCAWRGRADFLYIGRRACAGKTWENMGKRELVPAPNLRINANFAKIFAKNFREK